MIASQSQHDMQSGQTLQLLEACTQRVLQVVSHVDPRYGGLSSTVPALIAQLNCHPGDRENRLAAFCRPTEHMLPQGLSPVPVTFWPAARKEWIRNTPMVEDFKDEVMRADALHIHGLWEQSTSQAARLARQGGKPYVLSAHGMLEPWALANKRLKKLLYGVFVERGNVARAACLHALTHAEARQYRSFGARSPIFVIPNAVDAPASANASDFLDSFPDLEGKRLILFLSRLHPKKGADLLVRAWSQVASSFSDAHLILAGPDSEGTEEQLRLLVRQLGLENSVSFPGMLTGPKKWGAFAAATAFILPSHSEGLPVSTLEALAMGTPVIVTKACNLPAVSQCSAGWEVDVNESALLNALLACLEQTDTENKSMGTRGRRLNAERYAWPVVLKQFNLLYSWLLEGAEIKNIPPALAMNIAD